MKRIARDDSVCALSTAMLARLLAHCVAQIALDGEQGTFLWAKTGSDVERVFQFVAECLARANVGAVLDAPYRAYVWDALLAHPHVSLGVEEAAHAKSAKRTSVLGKSSEVPVPRRVANAPLAEAQATHRDALRVLVDAPIVRAKLTGTRDASFLSAAAYHVLQHVSRARAAGLTVVALGAATHYDQKTVYYLVKALLERDLVYVLCLTQRQVLRAGNGARLQLHRVQGLPRRQSPVARAAGRARSRGRRGGRADVRRR